MRLNVEKLKELMRAGIIKEVSDCQKNDGSIRIDPKTVNDIEKEGMNIISKDLYAIMRHFNLSDMTSSDFTVKIQNLDKKSGYLIDVPASNLKDLLDMFDWDYNFSPVKTVKLFDALKMIPDNYNSRDEYGKIHTMFSLHEIHDIGGASYSVKGTLIDENQRFESLDELYEKVTELALTNSNRVIEEDQQNER